MTQISRLKRYAVNSTVPLQTEEYIHRRILGKLLWALVSTHIRKQLSALEKAK